jgi:prepilin-type N-terminal cleavage/methylation domain-containing protein
MVRMSMNNSINSGTAGFTLLEIMFAVLIMGVGFLALSQMEYLALNMKGKAEEGTVATNVIQFATDADMAVLKEVNQMNANVISNAANGRTIDLTYCDGGTDSICNNCPCDPFEFLTPNPDNGVDETTCVVVDIDDFNPSFLVYSDQSQCSSDIDTFKSNNMSPIVIVKRAVTTVDTLADPDTIDVSLTYSVKNIEQFINSGLSTSLRDTLVSQNYSVSGHVNDFSDITTIQSWTAIRSVHVP